MNWTETRDKLVEFGIDAGSLPLERQRHIDLRGANLGGADLRGAYLTGANLTGANLRGANLRDAYLRDAYLTGANLTGANLGGADLRGATLAGAYLTGAYLRDAYLGGTDLTGANLTGANLPTVLKIENLDSRILDLIHGGGKLEMSSWHTCETTHCRAGWAITLAGEAGRVLEDIYGPSVAGAIIYASSYPDLPIPDFAASNDEAMADIIARSVREV